MKKILDQNIKRLQQFKYPNSYNKPALFLLLLLALLLLLNPANVSATHIADDPNASCYSPDCPAAHDDPGNCTGCCWSCSGSGPLCGVNGDFTSPPSDEQCNISGPTNTPAPDVTSTPIPTVAPCGGIRMASPDYTCIDENTAKVRWSWTPVYQVSRYQLQVAADWEFNDLIIDRDVGSSVHYIDTNFQNPQQRVFSRVRISERDGEECPGGYDWSNRVASLRNCSATSPPPIITFERDDEIFCDASGNPTSDPSTGLLYTAVGCIPVEEAQLFTVFAIRWSIGVAGAIALILISYSGYLLILSRGDPEKVKTAKELITATIGGLIFLILSSFLYRTLAVDILGILTR